MNSETYWMQREASRRRRARACEMLYWFGFALLVAFILAFYCYVG